MKDIKQFHAALFYSQYIHCPSAEVADNRTNKLCGRSPPAPAFLLTENAIESIVKKVPRGKRNSEPKRNVSGLGTVIRLEAFKSRKPGSEERSGCS
jgi:hypothetical protein